MCDRDSMIDEIPQDNYRTQICTNLIFIISTAALQLRINGWAL